ncbi:MAG: undecaprenyldiphospho-muramoylpentapeptide beta-N-acetylglucosaminyltransferase [Deltaproteobacteria bacterium]|nr:undecaprenyldiphospho-muramoylpentapeptide beta-N-acetylglucosaminyltransferase [Deltaproteobacteria bacterium]
MKILIAGGGTGGHFFSGVAVGEAFLTRNGDNEIIYVGTRNGIEARVGPKEGLDVRFVTISGIKGKGLVSRLTAVAKIPLSILQSAVLILKERPKIVIGVGGYASGPVVLAARLLGRKTAVVEQNSVAGATNRILGKVVHRVFVAFSPATKDFPPGKAEVIGNPVRERFVQLLTLESTQTVGVGRKLKVLVVGGSQGAHAVNVAMIEAVSGMSDELKERLHVTHQTGTKDEELVKDGYEAAGVPSKVLPFIDDMAEAYRFADLVVCRAGAMTVSELMISRRGSLLVPLPQAIYDHQTTNAKVLVDGGAGELLVQNADLASNLRAALERLEGSRTTLQQMAGKAGELGKPAAAAEVVDVMYKLVGRP